MADDNKCVICKEDAYRFCPTCGHLCISHTCDHLRAIDHEVIEMEEEGYPQDGVVEYEVVTESLKSYLSDEVMIASMSDAMLSQALERYKHILKVIENEQHRRIHFGSTNRTIRYHYNSTNSNPRKVAIKSPLELLIKAIKRGKLTKEMIERMIAK